MRHLYRSMWGVKQTGCWGYKLKNSISCKSTYMLQFICIVNGSRWSFIVHLKLYKHHRYTIDKVTKERVKFANSSASRSNLCQPIDNSPLDKPDSAWPSDSGTGHNRPGYWRPIRSFGGRKTLRLRCCGAYRKSEWTGESYHKFTPNDVSHIIAAGYYGYYVLYAQSIRS